MVELVGLVVLAALAVGVFLTPPGWGDRPGWDDRSDEEF